MEQGVTALSAERCAGDLYILSSLQSNTIHRRVIFCHYVIVIKSCLNSRTKERKTYNYQVFCSVNKTLISALRKLSACLCIFHDP
jgi:hypothetical protein